MKPLTPQSILSLWHRCNNLPGGKWIFSRLLGIMIPYSGSIGANVITLEPGHSVLILCDRKKVRNHLNSIHALALANVAELASGLAVFTTVPEGMRGIVTGLSFNYLKKARGTLTAECHFTGLEPGIEKEYEAYVTVKDTAGDEVVTATAKWLIGPVVPKE